MKITDLTVRRFRYLSNTVRDSEGHGHPGDEHEAVQSLLTIHTDEGVEGYFYGSPRRLSSTAWSSPTLPAKTRSIESGSGTI